MKTIIDMAREANVLIFDRLNLITSDIDGLNRFAELVRADERDRAMRENAYVLAEREACAQLCDRFANRMMTAEECADAIRSRGNT